MARKFSTHVIVTTEYFVSGDNEAAFKEAVQDLKRSEKNRVDETSTFSKDGGWSYRKKRRSPTLIVGVNIGSKKNRD